MESKKNKRPPTTMIRPESDEAARQGQRLQTINDPKHAVKSGSAAKHQLR